MSPIDTVRRQVRAVRWRTNLRAVQYAVAVWIAALALVATGVVLAALRGDRASFGLIAVAGALLLGGAGWALARRTHREWLRARDAPARIDAQRGLRGRVASAVELDGRTRGDLFALLARQNAEALPRWRPEDVVPEVVPGRAFGAAVVAVALLAAVIALAPRLRRPPPRVLVSDRAIDFMAGGGTGIGDADRLLAAPGTEHPGPGGAAAGEDSGGAELAELSATLQSWLQEALGVQDAWEPADQPPATRGGQVERPADGPERRRAPARPTTGDGDAAGDPAPIDGDDPAAQRAGAPQGGRPASGIGQGAGDGTDPELFGAPGAESPAPPDRFELAIAARVRTRHGGAAAPWTTAPGRETDRQPHLGPRRRWEQPGHRMAVPPSLAPLVQRLYAHPAPVPGGAR